MCFIRSLLTLSTDCGSVELNFSHLGETFLLTIFSHILIDGNQWVFGAPYAPFPLSPSVITAMLRKHVVGLLVLPSRNLISVKQNTT